MQTALQMIPGRFAALKPEDYPYLKEISLKLSATADLKVEPLNYSLNFDPRSLFNFS